MDHGEDFHGGFRDAMGGVIGQVRYDKFAGSFHVATPAHVGVVLQQDHGVPDGLMTRIAASRLSFAM
jgi:hypothetical protein